MAGFQTKRLYIVNKALDIAPTGHTVDLEPAAINNVDIQRQLKTFQIAANGSAGAVKATAFDNLIKVELLALIDNHIDVVMGVDIVGGDASYNCKVTNVTRGILNDDIFFNDATDVFVIQCEITVSID